MKQFLTMRDLAERYGLSIATICNHVRTGKLPKGIYIGKAHRWDITDIEAFERSLAEDNSHDDTPQH